MTALHRFYTKVRKIPLIGSCVKGARDLYHHPVLENKRLFARDVKAAHVALKKLYGQEHAVHKELDVFVRSKGFSRSFSEGHAGDFDAMMLYALVRAEMPETVVETGVASGRSSSAILAALSSNNKGRLHSIDLPKFYAQGTKPEHYTTEEGNQELVGFVPEGEQPGWLIPNELRVRWNLILGDSNEELPKLFEKESVVNIYYHDGDHSYKSMCFEFEQAWERLPEGGLLLSDDIDWNDAWKECVERVRPSLVTTYRHFGIARK